MSGEESGGGLGLYALLSRLGFPKSYPGKIAVAAFLGTHAPLVALVLYLFFISPRSFAGHPGALVVLLTATLLGFVLTLWALYSLLGPVQRASSSLREYLDSGELPDLPIEFSDDAGRLMANVRHTAEYMDSAIRSLEGISGTDHLSGLPNRRRAEERLAEETADMGRNGSLITLGVVDVNGFKQINDNHGHQAGDVCIRHVAEVVARNVREGDWLARWGGDEFLLVLHDTSVFAPTETVFQRITQDLKKSPVRLPRGQELTLSVSVGAVRYAGGSTAEVDFAELFARADVAMYEAKRGARAWVLVN